MTNLSEATSHEKEAAYAKTDQCGFCDRKGLVTIYHPDYKGQTYASITSRHGEVYVIRMRGVAYCVCPIGRWMRDANPRDKCTRNLADVIEQRLRWCLHDPSTPELPEEMAEMAWCDAWRLFQSKEHPGGPQPMPTRKSAEAEKARQRENWLVRFLVNALEAGPLTFESLAERARDAGRNNLKELRVAGNLARIKITHQDDQELWSLE